MGSNHRPTAIMGSCTTAVLYQYLLWCAASVATWSFESHNTTHQMSFVLRTTRPCSATNVYALAYPPTTNIALQPLGANPQIITLPFLIPIDKLVLCWGQHHLLLSVCLLFPCGSVNRHSFQHTCFIVTSTGLISERTLTGVSRLA
jgi:hypothetical protein